MVNLQGAVITQIDMSEFKGFKVEVTDISKWQQNLFQLLPYFGKVIFEEYEKETLNLNDPQMYQRALHQLEISFKDISYMYVLQESSNFVGLIAIKVIQENPKIGIVIELILEQNYRDKKISPKLYELVFNQKDFYALTSYSKFPAAVSSRLKVGNEFEYETFFGTPPENRIDVIELQNLAKEYFKAEGIVSEMQTPQGFIFLKGEENINSPLLEGEAKFDPEDPLFEPFEKILELQSTNAKDTAVGLLVSIKKS